MTIANLTLLNLR